MALFFRFLLIVIGSYFKKKPRDAHNPLEASFYVLPTDIDLNVHMVNSRYPAFIDLLRIKFAMETGLLKEIRALGGKPVLGASYIRFRRELKPFAKFTVKIELVYVSPRWFYLDYKFIKDGFVHCHSIEKWGGFIPTKGMIPPQTLLKSNPSIVYFPKPPSHIAKIMSVEDEMRIIVRKD